MTPEVSKLLEQALSLSVEEQKALADSLISNLYFEPRRKSRRGGPGGLGRRDQEARR
jgi:spore coat protein CotF